MVGCLLKEDPKGDFAAKFRAALTAESGLQQVETAPGFADLLAVKDSTELACVKRASIFSAVVVQKFLVQQLESIVDEEKKISHEQLAADTEDAFSEPIKLGVKLSPDLLESCYSPIIQSGGNFNLKPSAASNGDMLYYGDCLFAPTALPSHAHGSPLCQSPLRQGFHPQVRTWAQVPLPARWGRATSLTAPTSAVRT